MYDIYYNNLHSSIHPTIQEGTIHHIDANILYNWEELGDGYGYAMANYNGGFIVYTKLIGDRWYIHREDGPAVIQDDTKFFFYDGINHVMEDMPVSNEMKCVWSLKYTLPPFRPHEDYIWYN